MFSPFTPCYCLSCLQFSLLLCFDSSFCYRSLATLCYAYALNKQQFLLFINSCSSAQILKFLRSNVHKTYFYTLVTNTDLYIYSR